MKKLLIIILLVLQFSNIHAQDGFDIPNLPSSPTASELGKYGAIPISYYTGTPNINIPIYTLEAKEFKLPISLSYHASGIKVNDIAPWTGLGWHLNAGGGITVGIVGRSDFSSNRVDIREIPELIDLDIPSDSDLQHLADKSKDAQPDIFNYNFCGYSGQFVLDEDFNVHFLKNHGGIKIDCYKNEKKIVATDQMGIKYFFEVYETSNIDWYTKYYSPADDTIYPDQTYEVGCDDEITNFMISKILLVNGDEISFSYRNEIVEHVSGLSGSISAYTNSSNNFDWHGGQAFSFTETINNSKKLSEINYKDCKITFSANHQREDIYNTYALTGISISIGGETISNWELDYSNYFISVNKQITYGVLNNTWKKRLKLNSLTQKSADNTLSHPPYVFKYFGDDDNSYKLPPRNSFDGFDHWGYCNKSVTSSDVDIPSRLFPSVGGGYPGQDEKFLCLYSAQNNSGINWTSSFTFLNANEVPSFSGGVRESNDFAKSFSLKEIQYPTGGHTQFDYESNQYKIAYSSVYHNGSVGEDNFCGGLRIKSIKDVDVENSNFNVRTFEYGSGIIIGEPYFLKETVSWDDMYKCGNPNHIADSPSGYTLTTGSFDQLFEFGSENIAYTKVTEKRDDGKVVYYYRAAHQDQIKFEYCYVYKQKNYDNKFYSGIYGEYEPIYPFTTGEYSNSYFRGLIDVTYYYDINDSLVRIEDFEYEDVADPDQVFGNEVLHLSDGIGSGAYFINAYHHKTGKSFLIKKTIKEYEDNQEIVTTVDYTHNHSLELLETEEVTLNTGDIIKTQYRYPHDIKKSHIHSVGSPEAYGVARLVGIHKIGFPMETIKMKNGSVIGANLTYYRTADNSADGLPVPYKSFALEIEQPINNLSITKLESMPDGTYDITKDSRYQEKAEFVCDYKGNMIRYQKNNSIPNSFIWDNNNRSIIASSINATNSEIAYSSFETGSLNYAKYGGWHNCYGPTWVLYEDGKTGSKSLGYPDGDPENPQVGAILETQKTLLPGKYKLQFYGKWARPYNSNKIINNIDAQYASFGVGDWQFVEWELELPTAQKLKLYLNNVKIDELRIYPSDALITTYTYTPQMSISEINDSKGNMRYYEYDDFGRLKVIRDKDKNIQESYDYNYKLNGESK